MKRLLSPAIIALLIAANADAETVYVTDILRLGIHRGHVERHHDCKPTWAEGGAVKGVE
jgi:hypothetical protein